MQLQTQAGASPGDGIRSGLSGLTAKAHVRFKAFSVIRDVMGAEYVDVEVDQPGTVQDVMDALLARFGEDLREKLWDREENAMTPFLIRLNDEIIRSRFDMGRSVEDGGEVAFIFPIGGG